MGDFKSKHAYFGCKNQNKEGDILFDIIEDLNLLVVNDDQTTYHKGTDYSKILDLSIISKKLATKVESFEVGVDIGSDHLPIHLTLNSDKITKQRIKEILKF